MRRLLCLLLLLIGGSFGATLATAEEVVPTSQDQITLTFAPVVKRAAPAVVNIYTHKLIEEQMGPFFDDPFFRQFFGEGLNLGRQRERSENSLGSGVIVKSDGLIVTNNHVIKGADEIKVVLNDGREFDAKVVAQDERMDLSLLRLDTKGEALPVLELRDSDELEIGDLVLAIGNPFGVGQTVTSGIVSGLARTQTGINDFGFFIQTDAAINPGNSGGALVTTDGRLVGINTAIYSKSGGSIGIGFAIPSAMVRAFVDAEANGGKLVRPWIGAAGESVTAEIAKSLNLSRPGGVVIKEVYPEGPADAAGLMPGDIVLAINGKSVLDPQGLAFRLATLRIGGEANLSVVRKGEEIELPIVLATAPKSPEPNETLLKGDQPMQGAVVANLSPALAEELSLATWKGVTIMKVQRGSYAHEFGFRPGDVVAQINGAAIHTIADLEMALGQSEEWQIAILRDGKLRTMDIH